MDDLIPGDKRQSACERLREERAAVTARQRERETQLVWVGQQFRAALESYHRATPGPVKHLPVSLDELARLPVYAIVVHTDGSRAAIERSRTILIAVMSNTVVKTGMALSVGAPELKKAFLPFATLLLIAGAGAVFLVG